MKFWQKTFNETKWRRHLSAILAAAMTIATLSPLAASAAGLSASSVKLSDPRPDATAASVTYTVKYTVATTGNIQCIDYNVYTTANGTTVPTGFSNSAATNGTFVGLSGSWTIDNTTNGRIRNVNASGGSVSSGTAVTTPINSVTNPTNVAGESDYVLITTYSNSACTTVVDTTTVAFATTPSVLVSATVDPTLTFTVAGVAASTTYKGALQTSDRCQDSATAVTFGTTASRLAADTNYDCAQSLTTSTNATGGYQVTVQGKQASGDFLKMNGQPTNTITNWTGTNGTPTASPTSGSSEAFAYTSSDSTLSGTATRFTTSDNLFAGLTTTADEVAYSSTAAANDSVNVGLRLRFTGTTEAGTYQGTLVYTCTPVF